MESVILILYIIRLFMYYMLIQKYKLGYKGETIFFFIEFITFTIIVLFAIDAKETIKQVYQKYWFNLPFKRKLLYILLVVSMVYGLFVDYTRSHIIANGMKDMKTLINYTYGVMFLSTFYMLVIYHNK